MKHPHAEEIHAWADGKKIEKFLGCTTKGAPVWSDDKNPSWDLDSEYRVKPEVYGPQRVAEGGLSYFTEASGTISYLDDCYSRFEDKLFAIGNYYHTVAEAEKARDNGVMDIRSLIKELQKIESEVCNDNEHTGVVCMDEGGGWGNIVEVKVWDSDVAIVFGGGSPFSDWGE